MLRGPTSVLYGKGDAGGIVNRINKRQRVDSPREVEVQLGSSMPADRLQQTYLPARLLGKRGRNSYTLMLTFGPIANFQTVGRNAIENPFKNKGSEL